LIGRKFPLGFFFQYIQRSDSAQQPIARLVLSSRRSDIGETAAPNGDEQSFSAAPSGRSAAGRRAHAPLGGDRDKICLRSIHCLRGRSAQVRAARETDGRLAR
jgi:hypothetical protein